MLLVWLRNLLPDTTGALPDVPSPGRVGPRAVAAVPPRSGVGRLGASTQWTVTCVPIAMNA